MTPSLVLGRGGLLGRHVEAALDIVGDTVFRPEEGIRWDEPFSVLEDLDLLTDAFFSAVDGGPWRIFWCAGAGVVATSEVALTNETELLETFAIRLRSRLVRSPDLASNGTIFFASSAGGVYAATGARPPFDEASPVRPLAPYGRAKLAQERLLKALANETGTGLVIGRLSNLYGPGQKLDKPQGLIAHVGWAALRREPVSIYVPLDTVRDYLFAEDAARMVVAATRRSEDARGTPGAALTITKIFASEVETTVALVLAAWRRALHRPLRVALADSPVGRLQPHVLSFRSRVWPDILGRPMLLPLGVDAVRRDQLARMLAVGIG